MGIAMLIWTMMPDYPSHAGTMPRFCARFGAPIAMTS